MRYFFDIHDNGQVFADEAGEEFPSPEAAVTHARRLLLDIGNDEIPRNGPARSILVHIRSEGGLMAEVSLDFRTSPQVRFDQNQAR